MKQLIVKPTKFREGFDINRQREYPTRLFLEPTLAEDNKRENRRKKEE